MKSVRSAPSDLDSTAFLRFLKSDPPDHTDSLFSVLAFRSRLQGPKYYQISALSGWPQLKFCGARGSKAVLHGSKRFSRLKSGSRGSKAALRGSKAVLRGSKKRGLDKKKRGFDWKAFGLSSEVLFRTLH